MLKENRILVTGGAGFIGHRLVNRLARENCKRVIVFDKYIQPDKFQITSNLELIQGEIGDEEKLQSIMRGVDCVFHLAVLPLSACTENPRACLETNIQGTFNLLETARNASVRKIVFSSASSVYGDTEETMDESHPLNAQTMYGASKIAGEYLLRAFYSMYKLDYVILRYMNVYGPGQEDGLIVSVLKRIKQGLPPVIFGDGSQAFDFVYVDDVVNANILAMESSISNEAFNIGSGEEVTVKEIVHTLLSLTGSTLTPEFKFNEKVPMQRRVGSSQKAREMLGYVPCFQLRDGLRKTIEELSV